MTETNRPSTPQDPKEPPMEEQICPQCGKTLYQCDCVERWENEGGPSNPGPSGPND